ncbi:MAG: hypothetical protein A6F71_09430 [Cycloclasticus sp. symbiont of Poecilosclerida sp. M]|nr:MAG: hypothetical protein A6F71_09430 [Cycloclasticus sp. symbiont of Poecilosclerida sp. M]
MDVKEACKAAVETLGYEEMKEEQLKVVTNFVEGKIIATKMSWTVYFMVSIQAVMYLLSFPLDLEKASAMHVCLGCSTGFLVRNPWWWY